jgi:hypothetical protein
MEVRQWKLVGKIILIPISYIVGKEKFAALSAAALIGWLLYDLSRVQLRRRRVLRTLLASLVGTSLLLLALCLWFRQSWLPLGWAGLVLAVIALIVWFARRPERLLARTPRSLLDEYRDTGYNTPLMKKRYGGYLYEVRGQRSALHIDRENRLWRIELDCGVSRNVIDVAFLSVELTEEPRCFLEKASLLARGRIETFEPTCICLGRGNLFT